MIWRYFNQTTKAAPLAVFRIFFGIMMFISIVRFWYNGWIEKLYLQPTFFFSYYGFEWVKPLGHYTYLLFAICGLSALFIALGWKYRFSAVVFFLSFTYIELMDKTTYLNHYYFISLVGLLMIFLPAGNYFSFDTHQNPKQSFEYVPRWSIDALKLMIGIVYFYAGLAKLNSDWLINAMPLSIWLPGKYDLPLLGNLLEQQWVAYAFSWGGVFYDLLIPFLLLFKPTRTVAFLLVVVFHILTRVLFPIGMFPYIMIVSALIFFDYRIHEKILQFIAKTFRISKSIFDNGKKLTSPFGHFQKSIILILIFFFIVQITLPFRYILYPNELFWTEEGFRFSWRVMLMEKAGYARFKVVDNDNKPFWVNNSDFLSTFQEKQMATQPDFILEYAHFLKEHYQQKGITSPEIYVDSYVALNGRRSKRYIDPEVNLAEQHDSFASKTWILPFDDEVKGL